MRYSQLLLLSFKQIGIEEYKREILTGNLKQTFDSVFRCSFLCNCYTVRKDIANCFQQLLQEDTSTEGGYYSSANVYKGLSIHCLIHIFFYFKNMPAGERMAGPTIPTTVMNLSTGGRAQQWVLQSLSTSVKKCFKKYIGICFAVLNQRILSNNSDDIFNSL